jgi:small conductance mechanosensitive channel
MARLQVTERLLGECKRYSLLALALLVLGTAVLAPVAAQEGAPESESSTVIPAEVAESIDAKLERMARLREEIVRVDERVTGAEGLQRKILEARLTRYWDELVDKAHSLAREIVTLRNEGQDVSAYEKTVTGVLEIAPAALFREIDRAGDRIVFPAEDQSPAQQAAVDADARAAVRRITSLYRAILSNTELANEFGIDTAVVEDELNARLQETAASVSAFLDLSLADASAARDQLTALPQDADVAGRVAVADHRVKLLSSALKGLTALMTRQELDTTVYDAQLIATTGEITTDIFDVSVLAGLFSGWFSDIGDWFVENAGSLVFSVLIFLAILFIAFKLASLAQKLITHALSASSVQMSTLLNRMIVSTTRSLIIAIGVLVALAQLGISLGPLLAGLGIAGFVIGFALQDTLSNFASGLMILLYRPFDVGDVVEVSAGVNGTVSHMSLVNTTVLTFDNQTLVVPNNSIWQNVIKNVTAQTKRRVDMMFGIGYSDDIPKAEKILTDIVEHHEAVLKDPEPVVKLHELGDSSVNFIVRPWVKTDDYWPVYWDITRTVKLRFDEEGVSIPFPQRDVHLFAESPVLATATPGAAEEMPNSTIRHRREFDTPIEDAGDGE